MNSSLQLAPADRGVAQRDPVAPQHIRQAEICRLFGISDETWRRWRAAGETPRPVDLPGRPRWLRREVDAFMAGRGNGRRRVYFGAVRRRA